MKEETKEVILEQKSLKNSSSDVNEVWPDVVVKLKKTMINLLDESKGQAPTNKEHWWWKKRRAIRSKKPRELVIKHNFA